MRKITVMLFDKNLDLGGVEWLTLRKSIEGKTFKERKKYVQDMLQRTSGGRMNCTVTWKFDGYVEGFTTTMSTKK